MSDSSSSPVVGLVLGSQDATPLEFWFGVRGGHHVQLDDLVVTRTTLSDGQTVTFYGIVDIVRKRFEGSQFDTDAFRVPDGTLPADVSYAAHVQVTRVEPELFVPPGPGEAVSVVRDEEFRRALYFDRMERSVAIGLTRTGEPVHANLEFLDGTRGAHASISGVSGVATKTSYATFILYSLFHSGALGLDAANAKALIFNVTFSGSTNRTRSSRRTHERNTSDSVCRMGHSRAWRSSRPPGKAATLRCLTPAADKRACNRTYGRCESSAARSCCDSCSWRATTLVLRSIW